MAENNEGSTPSQDDLMSWMESYGTEGGEHPILADSGWAVGSRFEADGGIPSMSLLGPGAEVLMADEWVQASDIEAALP